jgi:hypothetical protein
VSSLLFTKRIKLPCVHFLANYGTELGRGKRRDYADWHSVFLVFLIGRLCPSVCPHGSSPKLFIEFRIGLSVSGTVHCIH